MKINGIDFKISEQLDKRDSKFVDDSINNSALNFVSDSFAYESIKVKNNEPFGNFKDEDPFKIMLEKASSIPRDLKELPDFTKTPLRIGVAVAQKQADITIPSGTLFVETSEGKKEIGHFENTTFKTKAENNGISLYSSDGKLIGNYSGKILLEDNIAPISINGKKYRGGMEIIINPADNSTLTVINDVMAEDYLRGVVPSESSASWPVESLKAQALAARTYAIANWKRRESLGFDLMATTSDQVYNGLGVEQASTDQAIKETNGQVILYNGKPINALFFASSGGHTDSALEVWNIDLPYIQGVKDFDQNAPKYKWTKNVTNASVQDALKQMGIKIGEIKSIEPTEFTTFKRVKKIKFTGTDGTVVVDSNKFRFALGLNSTLWTVTPSNDKKFSFLKLQTIPKSFSFNGGGWGHGLGMSQWGARQMALDGKTGNEIIKHYYTGVEIGNLYQNQNESDNIKN